MRPTATSTSTSARRGARGARAAHRHRPLVYAGATKIVDCKPYAVGTIKATYEKYPNSGAILPAMGCSDRQIADLEASINATPCDVVVEGTPIDLTRALKANKPIAEVTYELGEIEPGVIKQMVKKAMK